MSDEKNVVRAPAFREFQRPFRMEGTVQYLRKFSRPHPTSPLKAPTKTRTMGISMKTARRIMETAKLMTENQSTEPLHLNDLVLLLIPSPPAHLEVAFKIVFYHMD